MNPLYSKVADRALHRCEYRHAPEAVFNFPFEVEHVYPQSYGGSDDQANLALACRSCNLFKSNTIEFLDSETQMVVPLFHPQQDKWDEHFRVVLATGEIIGLTPMGRATVQCLKLNSEVQQTARKQWARLGLFP